MRDRGLFGRLFGLSAVLGGFLFMMAPNVRRDVSAFSGKRFAHRGLYNKTVPENSIPAFQRAALIGMGVELDVQMTSDHRLVVFHDGDLKRMCGIDGALSSFTYEELKQFCLKDTDETIPLFSEVLKTLNGVDLICEIKSDNGIKNYELCERTYEMLKDYPGRFCVESFSPYLMGWFRKNHPQIIRGQLSCKMNDAAYGRITNAALTNLMLNYISRPDFIAYDHEEASRSLGFLLVRNIFHPLCVCWTPKGEEEIRRAERLFDTVIFEEDQ